jgi:predicted nucleic acid-binding protein
VRLVLDASVVLEALLRRTAAEAAVGWMLDQRHTLHAPHLLDGEVAQVGRRYAAAGDISGLRGRELLEDLADLPIERYPHDVLLPRVWTLRNNLTAYDAVYVALAEALDATLLTTDRRIAAAPGLSAMVETL